MLQDHLRNSWLPSMTWYFLAFLLVDSVKFFYTVSACKSNSTFSKNFNLYLLIFVDVIHLLIIISFGFADRVWCAFYISFLGYPPLHFSPSLCLLVFFLLFYTLLFLHCFCHNPNPGHDRRIGTSPYASLPQQNFIKILAEFPL